MTMGKASRKMSKKRKQERAKEKEQQIAQLREELRFHEKELQYTESIEVLAKMLELGCRDPEMYFSIARNYFMAGDYERSSMWVDNTLSAAPGHVGARLLLMRLCLNSDRIDDALAIAEFLLAHSKQSLNEEQQEELQQLLGYCARTDREHVRRNYPLSAEFIHADAMDEPAPAQPEQERAAEHSSSGSALAALRRLKEKLEQGKPEAAE